MPEVFFCTRCLRIIYVVYSQTEKNERNVQSLVTKVMRVFVDAFPHVPEHRRLPVFAHLLTTLGASRYLHICFALLLEKISNKEAKVSKHETFVGIRYWQLVLHV